MSHGVVPGTQSRTAAPVLGGARRAGSALREERPERQPPHGPEERRPLHRLRPPRGEAGTAPAAARMRREAVLAPSFERGGVAGARTSAGPRRARGEPRGWGDAAAAERSRGPEGGNSPARLVWALRLIALPGSRLGPREAVGCPPVRGERCQRVTSFWSVPLR